MKIGRRDPMTPRARRALIKDLLTRANRGEMDAADVLLDVIHDEHPDLAEGLAHALARSREPLAAYRLPLIDALENIGRQLFPKRRGPCMPNRRDLERLFDLPEDSNRFVYVWKALERACATDSAHAGRRGGGGAPREQAIRNAMREANDVLDGFGVEVIELETRRAGRVWGFYVNMGDAYDRTLVWDARGARFHVTSWGDVVERWERRWGRIYND